MKKTKFWLPRILFIILCLCMLTLAGCDSVEDDSDTDDTTTDHVHTLVDHEAKAPTCTENGWRAYQTCSACDYTTYEELDPLGHNYANTYAPNGNVHSRFCSRCDATLDADHDYEYKETVKEVTCDRFGVEIHKCSVCGYEKNIGVDPLGHAIVSVDTEPTCTAPGYVYNLCSTCGYEYTEEYGAALGHSYTYEIVDPTCTDSGKTVYICSCGDTYYEDEVDPLGHHYSAYIIGPTCTEEGKTVYTCDCGDTYFETIVALGHLDDIVLPAQDPTCTEIGFSSGVRCSRCSVITTAQNSVPALGHLNDVIFPSKAPTCEKPGLTVGAQCSRCNTVTLAQSVVPATGHSYTSSVVEPDCINDGYTEHTCAVCGSHYTDASVPALGHNYGEATCEEAATCITCGAPTGSPIGHDWSLPTCTDPKICQRNGCDATDGEPLGHSLSEYICTEPQTCIRGCGYTVGEKGTHTVLVTYADGTVTYVCSDCSTSFSLATQQYYMDGSGYNGMYGLANLDRGFGALQSGTAQQPIITDEGYYTLIKETEPGSEAAQFQIWFPKEDKTAGSFSSANNAVGFFSFKINAYVDTNFNTQLIDASSSGKRWSADWCIAKNIFSISAPKADGDKLYVTVTGMNSILLAKIEVMADDPYTGWFDVAMGIALDPISDSVYIYYYIDGKFIGQTHTALTTTTNAINSIYMSGNTKAKGSGIMLDDVVFGYTTNAAWTFDEHDHDWALHASVYPWCETEGYTTYRCNDCGKVRFEDYVPALGHDYTGSYKPNGDVHSLVCLRCGNTKDEAHVLTMHEQLVAPTCGASGLAVVSCSVCGFAGTSTIPATGEHTDGGWQIVSMPTATVRGREQLLCAVCEGVIHERDIACDADSMPTLYLSGDYTAAGNQKNEVPMQVIYANPNGQTFDGYATIKVQGSSSVAYPKKNYTIKFFKDEDCTSKQKLDLGWGKESKYVIKANWVDFTNARNVVSCRLWGDLVASRNFSENQQRLAALKTNGGAIDGFAIAVYMNGEFHGLYTMNVPKDEWMFDMDDSETEALIAADNWNSTNFSVFIEGFEEDANGDILSLDGGWELRYCGSDDYSWVAESFDRLIKFCQDNDGEAFRDGIHQYLDVDAAIDYVIFMYTNGMRDNASKNMLWATYDGHTWIPSVYDQDGTFGQSWDGVNALTPEKNLPFVKNGVVDVNINFGPTIPKFILWERILNCFTEEVLLRYQYLRQTTLSTENIIAELQAFEDSVPASVYEADRLKWAEARESWWAGKNGKGVWYEKYNFEYMYSWVEQRMGYLDQAMSDIYYNAYLPKTNNPAL